MYFLFGSYLQIIQRYRQLNLVVKALSVFWLPFILQYSSLSVTIESLYDYFIVRRNIVFPFWKHFSNHSKCVSYNGISTLSSSSTENQMDCFEFLKFTSVRGWFNKVNVNRPISQFLVVSMIKQSLVQKTCIIAVWTKVF